MSDFVAETNQTVIEVQRTGLVELNQQHLWQIELTQLAKEVEPLLLSTMKSM